MVAAEGASTIELSVDEGAFVAVVELVGDLGKVNFEIALGFGTFVLPFCRFWGIFAGLGGGFGRTLPLTCGVGAVVEGLVARHGGLGKELFTIDEYTLLAVHRCHL